MSTVFVCPGLGVAVFSRDRMEKNKPTMARSAAMAAGVSWVSGKSRPAKVYMPHNSFGVMTRCCLGAGLAFAKALKRERVAGSNWAEPPTCKGLGCRLFRKAVAKLLVAWRKVPVTIGFLRSPAISPLPFLN
jgi:hypothetical protein